MSNLFQILLSSAVVVTILNNIVIIFNHNKDSKLQHITAECSTWRNEIKSIALELEESNLENIKSVLTKLKVRINAYGQRPDGNYPENDKLNFLTDEHLWKIISNTENCNKDNELKNNKTKLINSLSCLLKFDWECSKEEVNSSKMGIISIILLTFSICIYIGVDFILFHVFDDKNIGEIVLRMLNMFFYLVSPYIVSALPYWLDVPKLLQTQKWYMKNHKKSYIIGCIYLVLIIILQCHLVSNMNLEKYMVLVSIAVFFYVFSIIFYLIFYDKKRKLYINYHDSISNIRNYMKKILKNLKSDV